MSVSTNIPDRIAIRSKLERKIKIAKQPVNSVSFVCRERNLHEEEKENEDCSLFFHEEIHYESR